MMEIFDGDSELVSYMQKAVGYALCGDVSEHCLFVLYGTGKNGKSTFIKRIAAILGDYASNASSSLLVESRFDSNGPSSDIARLRGVRLVTVLESKRGNTLDEAQVKALTGGDRITACFKYKEPFEFNPTFKIFFSTNHKPEIVGTDEGIWRRVRTIPFKHYFDKGEADLYLDEKLAAEHSGILNWMIDGYRMWKKGGLGENPTVNEATESYKQESDILGTFIEECCDIMPGASAGVSEIIIAFNGWRKEVKCRYISRVEIGEYFEKKLGLKKLRSFGRESRHWIWDGIELKNVVHGGQSFVHGDDRETPGRPY
jgi:putative DNA primase/helicase